MGRRSANPSPAAGILYVAEVPAPGPGNRLDRVVFLIQRSPKVSQPGTWSIPGGHVDPGESRWDAACRESEEEIGHAPEDWLMEDGVTEVHMSGHAFTTFIVPTEPFLPVPNDEVSEWLWVPESEVLGLPDLHPGFRSFWTRWVR